MNDLDDAAMEWGRRADEREALAAAFLYVEIGRLVRDVRLLVNRANDIAVSAILFLTR